ncbi:hypothetical protein J437_LFUL001917 [Ladona fulva]|uniref:Uncharacterized protein n=1 Tax=Ladona fulva TaxID=123851 RepID=A0A8K0NXK4_LADFU|nr:hypothetical protein J437_LFUL001917 [Ladona fulva]
MPCCSESQFSGNGDKIRGCTDVFCLSIFVGFWFLMILIAAFAIVFGNPLRLINGYDSFGNICGTSNTKFGRYVFFLNVENIKASMKICVKECPTKVLRTLEDIQQFYNETGSMLCRDRNITFFSPFGPCPVMPVYESSPLLNRCVPKASQGVANEIVGNLIAYLNSQEVMEQVLSDLYSTWKEILWLTIGAFVFSFLLILIFHLVAAIVSIILMGLVSVSSIGKQ